MTLRITAGDIHVFTFKEGVLSAMAHDLRLTIKRFRVTVDAASVHAEFFTDTIVVDGAVRDGKLAPGVLSDKDRDKVRATMAGEVLRSSQFGRAEFRGTAVAAEGRIDVSGTLDLVGRQAPLAVTMARDGRTVRGAAELAPSVWGIRPYSALGGALRVQDRIRVEWTLGS